MTVMSGAVLRVQLTDGADEPHGGLTPVDDGDRLNTRAPLP